MRIFEDKPAAAPAFPFSGARLDGSSVHETRVGDDCTPDPGVTSVVYEVDGSTAITYADGLRVVATGYGRRVRLAVVHSPAVETVDIVITKEPLA